MADETVTRIRRGERATVTIIDRKQTGGDAQDEESARRRSAIMSGVLEDDDLLRRDVPNIVLLDLGTRLRSVNDLGPGVKDWTRARALTATDVPEYHETGDWLNEYVELAVDGAASVTDGLDPTNAANAGLQGFQAGLPDVLQKALDRAALGSRALGAVDPLDPLGTSKANYSGRKLFNCMPLPFELFGPSKGSIPVDIILKKQDRTEILPASEIPRPRVRLIGSPYNGGEAIPDISNERWKLRKASAKDADEKWNQLNLGGTSGASGNEAFQSGYLDTKGLGGGWQLEVDSRLYYERFDTSDTENFKVTRTADFEADEAEFTLNAGTSVRIYLKPCWMAGMPSRRYTATMEIRFSTYYWFFGHAPDGSPRVSIGHTVINQIGNLLITLLSTFAPEQGAITSDVTADLAAPDVAVSGGGGGFTFEAHGHGDGLTWDVLGQQHTSPGLAPAVEGFGVPDGAHGSATIVPGWQPNSAIFDFFTLVFYPVAYRAPVYAKVQLSGWSSVFEYMNENAAYQTAAGIQLGFNNPLGTQGAFPRFCHAPSGP
jgi:hypothetical protein